jgi:hypothetical protein
MLLVAGFALVAASCSSANTGGEPGGSLSGGNTASSGGKTSASSTVSSGGSSQPGDTGGASAADTGGSGETGGSSGGEASVGSTSSSGGTTSAPSTTAAGGSTKTGGTPSASSTTATGGSTKTGGTTGPAGTTAAGGSTKTGGTTGPASTTAAGGSTSAGGSSNAGGTPSSGGAGGGASVSPATVVPDLMGFYWEGTCAGNIPTHGKNCPFAPIGSTTTTCASGATWDTRGTIRDTTLNVKGTTGTTYTINFEVRGVAGTRCYTNGTPAVANMTPNANGSNNTWYVGGVQANNSIWNTYELHVNPPVPGEANVYFLNAFPSGSVWCEKEASYQIGYTASFKVLGGGTMKFTIHDSNCLAQQNCGPDDSATTTVCAAPRTVDLSGMTPAATFTQPPKNSVGGTTYYPQWLYFDVTSVTSP